MTDQTLYCRTCGKTRGKTARGPGQCQACAARLSGKRFGRTKPFIAEQVKDKARRLSTTSFWLEAGADYPAAAKRMAGNGWTE